jgi:AraC-like DNA-binding protein
LGIICSDFYNTSVHFRFIFAIKYLARMKQVAKWSEMYVLTENCVSASYSDQFRILNSIVNKNASTRVEILKRVNLAKDFLHTNYAGPINLQQVARAAFLSPSYLIRKFTEAFKITPYQYLRNLRFKKAQELIINTDLNIDQIAINLGFESTSSFIRAFKEIYMVTPGGMRKSGCHKPNESLNMRPEV